MTEYVSVAASEFCKNFETYQQHANSGKVIQVTSDGQTIGAYLSARDLEHYKRLTLRERQVYKAGELPNDIVEAIEQAKYGALPT
ncbi:hypothetical protein AB4072_08760 [Microvirga sp. 2MCAF38]|uniref:hypothetical protein n=1 Tax=Microvirga sp. 2MCAF38 TaxID=3232989 RepID=UPI003F9C67F7